jgi:LDH2 family malate/lactate/ureidoglycolate dehydrogenase
MADLAIEKAREHGIGLVFGGNHNDAGSFARYVYTSLRAGHDGHVFEQHGAAGSTLWRHAQQAILRTV